VGAYILLYATGYKENDDDNLVDPPHARGKVSDGERVRLATDAVGNAAFLGKRMETTLRPITSDRSTSVTVSETPVDTVPAAVQPYKKTALLSEPFFTNAIAGIAVATAITFQLV